MKAVRRLAIGGFLTLSICGSGCWLYLKWVHISWGCGVRVQFADLPADDKEIESWLRAQPGVVDRTVFVGREGNVVQVLCIHVRDGLGNPPKPDILGAFERFGYKVAVILPESP